MYSEKTNTKKMILEEHLFITAELATTIKKYLGGEEFQGEHEPDISVSVPFSNGVVMNIKCHGCDDAASWTEAILCEPLMLGSFNVVAATDPDDSFFQTWEIEYDGIIYRVTVEEKEAERMLV